MFTDPELTGTPTAPTQASSDNSTKIATTEFVKSAVSAVGVGSVSKTSLGLENVTNESKATMFTNPKFTGDINIQNALLTIIGGSWSQVGIDFDGERASDYSGQSVSVSADGKTVAIGSKGYNNLGGSVRVFDLNEISSSAVWTQRGLDIYGGGSNYNGYYLSLSADGNTVAISAINGNTGNGSVRVYDWNKTASPPAWIQRGTDIFGENINDTYGNPLNQYKISLSGNGNIVAIGAYGYSNSAGNVRIYYWNVTALPHAWTPLGLDIIGEHLNDSSGYSISLSDNGKIVAIGDISTNNSAGSVKVFYLDETALLPTWTQRGTNIIGENSGDQSGESISLSADGKILAIGATGNSNYKGNVRVFYWDEIAWTQRGTDIIGEQGGDYSGYSVSLSADGKIIAIGALWNDDNGSDSGNVRIFYWNEIAWTQLGTNIIGENSGDQSGYSVSLSADGKIVAIGAPRNNDTGSNSGQVRVYNYINQKVSPTELGYLSGTTSNIQSQLSQLSQLNDKAPLESPTFTGAPTAPTQASDDNSTKIATTQFVKTAVSTVGVYVNNTGQWSPQISDTATLGKMVFYNGTLFIFGEMWYGLQMKPLAYIEITVKDNKAIIDNTTTPKTITAYLEDGSITLLPTSDNSSQFVYYITESVTHATVNQSGVITLNSVGTNTIRIKQYETTNNSVVSVDYTLNIIQRPPSTPCGVLFTVSGDSLNFSPSSAALAQQGQNFNQLYKIIAYLLDSNNVPLQNGSSIILDNLTGGAISISTLGQPAGSHINVNTSGFMFDGTQIWQDYIDTGFTIPFPSSVVITSFSTYIYTLSYIPVGGQNPYIVIGPNGFYLCSNE